MTQSYEQLVAGANLIRQNELPESNTHTLVGEQMLQMVNKQQEADDSSRSEMYNVSRYHVNTDGTPVFTLDQAIALVPARLRVGGCVIKYQAATGEVIAYFNGSNIASWSNVSEWRVFISDKDFQLAEKTANKNQENGYPGLDGTGKLLKAQLPDTYQPISEKGRANGYPSLDAAGDIPDAQIPNTVERVGNKNKANGYPGLDGTGKLLKAQLPDTYQTVSEKGRANGYPALDATGAIPDAQIPNTVERTSKKNQANGYAGLDADGMLDNRQVRKAFGYSFEAINDGVAINHNDLLNFGANDFSVELLININSYFGSASQFIFIKSGGEARFGLLTDYKSITFLLNNGSSFYSIVGNKPLIPGKYTHIVCTINNRIPYLYVDGELVSIGINVGNSSFDNNSGLFLQGGSFNGKISLFRIYKRGFLQSDVDYYYNVGRPDLSRLIYPDKINKTTTGCVVELLPENSTQTKWLDTQNNLDGITSGNPLINYGNVVPEPYIKSFKKYIGLISSGDGSETIKLDLVTNKSGKVKINGGVFYDLTDSNIIGNELPIYKDSIFRISIKLTEYTGLIICDNLVSISVASIRLNSPRFNLNVSEIPDKFLTSSPISRLYGHVSDIPRSVTSLQLTSSVGDGFLKGTFMDLPKGLTYFSSYSSNIIGNLRDIKLATNINMYNTTADVTANLDELSSELETFEITGSALLSGDLGSMKGVYYNLSLFTVGNYTYSSGLKVSSELYRILIRPSKDVWTSAMTDRLLIDLASQVKILTGIKTIDLTGNCGAPTPASSTARSYLSGLGATVLTN